MENQANAFACQFRNKVNGKWSEWKTETYMVMTEVVSVTYGSDTYSVNSVHVSDCDDFDLGYLKAVNWLYQKQREFSYRKDIEFRFTPTRNEHWSAEDDQEIVYHMKRTTLETA